LGPTTPLIPLGKGMIVFSGKDLKPFNSRRLIFMDPIVTGAVRGCKEKNTIGGIRKKSCYYIW